MCWHNYVYIQNAEDEWHLTVFSIDMLKSLIKTISRQQLLPLGRKFWPITTASQTERGMIYFSFRSLLLLTHFLPFDFSTDTVPFHHYEIFNPRKKWEILCHSCTFDRGAALFSTMSNFKFRPLDSWLSLTSKKREGKFVFFRRRRRFCCNHNPSELTPCTKDGLKRLYYTTTTRYYFQTYRPI